MSPHILIFDSGLGGISVLHEIRLKMPHARFSYLIDNDAFPYGEKSDDWLKSRGKKLFAKLLSQVQPDLIILACNTASTLFLEDIRKQSSIAVIGVVPAIKPAAKISQTKTIGLLATQATISRGYIDQLHKNHGQDCTLIRFNAQPLVKLSENYLRQLSLDFTALDNLITDIKTHHLASEIDTIILGCTHFPALKEKLKERWGQPIHWIDSGEAIARRTLSLCTIIKKMPSTFECTLFYTKPDPTPHFSTPFKPYNILTSSLLLF